MNITRKAIRAIVYMFWDWMNIGSGALGFILSGLMYLHVLDWKKDEHEYLKTALAALGLSAIVANWKYWRLEEKHRPKLVVNFIGGDSGCIEQGGDGADTFRLFRLAVTNEGIDAVDECQGRLISVKHNAAYTFRYKTIILSFAPSENADTMSKTVRQGITEFLDVLDINGYGPRSIRTPAQPLPPHFPTMQQMFPQNGEYILRIAVFGKGMPTVFREFKLTLTGNYQTATMEAL